MSALLLVRAAIVTALTSNSELSGVHITTHGGDFTGKDLARYSKRAPALVIALLSFKPELQAGTVVALARWGVVAIAKNVPANPRDAGVIDLADKATRALMRFFQGFDAPAGMTVSAPRNFAAVNEYSPDLDAVDIALWGLAWDQQIDLVDPEILDLLATVDVKYDLIPLSQPGQEIGDQIEAEDLLEDLDE